MNTQYTTLPNGNKTCVMTDPSSGRKPDLAPLATLLLAGALLLPVSGAQASAVLTSLHSFGVVTNGAYPHTGLVQGNDGNFYGTTSFGGTNGGHGTIFKMSTNGAPSALYSFTGDIDGKYPSALVQGSDGYFYGTTVIGGTNGGYGTVFKISTNGVFSTLYSFIGTNYGLGGGGLVEGSDGNFYGKTASGGVYTNLYGRGQGSVFKISTNGTFTTLYSFTGTNDGADPVALVRGSDENFYGLAGGGGAYTDQNGQGGYGTIFKITRDGLLTSLYSFTGGSDSKFPTGLVEGSDGNFYGTTRSEYTVGTDEYGTVFQITPDGVLTTLHTFHLGGGNDGYYPNGLVAGSNGDFYGTTLFGGAYSRGTVFRISTNGALTSLYSFKGTDDGSYPNSLVRGSDGKFYGTTSEGDYKNGGSVFQITDAGDFVILYSFNFGNDGANPLAGLVQDRDGNFYGTTTGAIYGYGAGGYGTVFKISAAGVLTNLYFFDGIGGAHPAAGLVQGSDGNLYGTASSGGLNGYGSVFKISTNGAFTRLYSFTGGTDGESPAARLVQAKNGFFFGTTPNNYDNVFRITASGAFAVLTDFRDYNQNANPQALVQASDGNFYGTLADGFMSTQPPFYSEVFNYGYGTVFKMSSAGAVTTLHTFNCTDDGSNPLAGLVQGSDGNLYGTTSGGTNNAGSVFKISTNGLFTNLYFFTGGTDGATPLAALVQGSDGNLYGTTSGRGTYMNQYGHGYGTVFQISTNGAFTSLYSFTGGTDGAYPQAGLVQGSDGSFYGTTFGGGAAGAGSVFRLTVEPPSPVQLTTIRSGANVILSWPTNATGFVLQSATTLANGGDWQDSSLTPTVANGQQSVTVAPSGPRGFFRLRGP